MYLSRFSRALSIVLLLIGSFMTSTAITPDFAYPKTAAAGAEKALAKALAAHDSQGTLRSLMDLTIARSAISPDSIGKSITQIQQIRDKSDNPILRSLLNLLLADIYNQAYSSNRWNYDRRKLPLTPLPADFSEWSGEQFRARITELCDSALSCSGTLQSVPIGDYAQVISADRPTRVYYPTVYDFAAWKVISLLKSFDRRSGVLPLSRLSDASRFLAESTYVPASASTSFILRIYQDLLRFHHNDKAPFILADLSRISFIASQVYMSGDNVAEQTELLALLRALYDRFADSEYSGDILQEIASNGYEEANTATWLYDKISSNISRFPAYSGINCLRNLKAEMEQKQVRVEVPQATAPGIETRLRLAVRNTNSLRVNIYRLPDVLSTDTYYRTTATLPKLVKSLDLKVPGKIPFNTDTTVTVTLPETGIYIAVPSVDTSALAAGHSYPKIYCSRLSLAAYTFTAPTVVVIDPVTGAPVSDASVMSISNRRNIAPQSIATTSANGMARIASDANNVLNLVPTKGTDRSALPFYLYMGSDGINDNWRPFASAYTDLAIYRPGDRVAWTAIRYSSQGGKHRLEPHCNLTAVLYDASSQAIDTVSCTTDDFGRVEGHFDLPSNLLTGNFNIAIADASKPSSPLTYAGFMVSEYKLPSYVVKISSVLQNTPEQGDVTVTGDVATYSGFSMGGTSLDINLKGVSRSIWRGREEVSFYTTSSVTGPDGKFSIELPSAVLKQSPIPGEQFSIEVTALSNTGESRESSRYFALAPSYAIVASLPADIDVSKPLRLNLKVTDSEGSDTVTTVAYRLVSAGHTDITGSFSSSNPIVDWSKIEGGCYDIVFSTPDLPGTADFRCSDIALYRPSDKLPPRDTPVWIPVTTCSADHRKAKVLLGTSAPESNLLITLWTPGEIISQKWVKYTPGIRYYEVELPQGVDKATLSVSSTSAFRTSATGVTIDAGKPQGIKIEAETFRDKIVPGSKETWRFRVSALDNSGVTAAVILDMYNEALDALTRANWTFSPLSGSQRRFAWREPNVSSTVSAYTSSDLRRLKCTTISDPVFDTYGMPLFSSMRIRGGLMVANTMMRKSAAVMDMKEEAVMTVAQSDDMEASAPLYAAAAGSADSGEEEAAMEDAAPGDAAATTPEFAYRQSEVPLAFFRPMLTTDANGHLTFTFDVPDANTTWRFNAIAFTGDVRVTSYTAAVTSSKPVMVQPNLPRFVRTGDSLVISASVMNNTETDQSVTTVTEIFDPGTDRILFADSVVSDVAAMNSATASISLNVPFDTALLGYRIRSSVDGFADGEQALIPVLPSVQPVIETQTFYIAPDSADFSMSLRRAPDSATLTLQYCDNPTWYVVTALPALGNSEMRTAPDAAAAIFSAAVAEGLLRNNPAIADALRQWSESDRSDSTLVSMLDRNADLKTVLLESSPWMLDARSDTERMQRLALLFDTKLVDATYSKAIALLKKLQQPDGGWSWTADYPRSSEWATGSVLQLMGRLAQLGFVPADKTLKAMLPEAVKYIDQKAEMRYDLSPKSDFTSYVALRDMYPDVPLSLKCRTITELTVKGVLSAWKKMDVGMKAEAALMLYRHDYPTVARTILKSLRETSVYQPQAGMWWEAVNRSWPSGLSPAASILRAFSVIEPGCADVARICQWLILQKEAQNWGTAPIASEVISSILLAVPQWTCDAGTTEITINNTMIPVTPVVKRLGYLRTNIELPANSADNRLAVHRTGSTPAWGAVYTRFTDVMDRVEAQSSDALSVEKRILKQVSTHAGTEWQTADQMNVGDRVRIELTLHVKRNMEYVVITDERAACFEPTEQLPAPIVSDGLYFYRENLDASTRMFIDRLPVGTYILGYEMWVNNQGRFASGIATVQSQYAPEFSAHSGGSRLIIDKISETD